MYTSVSSILLAALAASTAISARPLMATERDDTATSSVPSSSFPSPVPAIAPADPGLITALDTAPSTVERYKKILDLNLPIKFPFNSGNAVGKGGKVVVASRANFPPLVKSNIAAAVGFLEPCGMNTLHTHPRATEFLTVVEGTVQTGFILENGLTNEFNTTLNQYEGTVFPQGSIHYQFNPNCAPAVFVAGLNAEDPGTSQLAQNILAVEDDVLEATFGFQEPVKAGADLAQFRKNVPANVAKGIQACLATCPQAANA